MGRFTRRRIRFLLSIPVLLGAAGIAASQMLPLPAHPVSTPTAADLLAKQFNDSEPNAEQLVRGRYLVAAGDCMSCHVREGGQPLAGGLGLNTPFGVIYTSNITPDPQTGIGAWTADQFYHAMHDGKGAHGEELYPAFPYPWFRRVSREDDDAIFAYLKTVPAVKYSPPKNDLPFPFNFRSMVGAWNMLYLDSHEFQSDPGQSTEWNRGAYLVNGLGHCGACHTPKNALGGDKSKQDLHGGKLDNWVAPDLTSNARVGLGDWDVEDIAEFLASGRNAHAAAGGAMADVITYSTSLMSDADRRAIAVYLKSQPASPGATSPAPDAAAMRRGAEIYSDACSSCHLDNGVGQSRLFPPLGKDAVLQQSDPTGVEHLILGGTNIGVGAARPSPLGMPSFAWKLTDQEIADVSTFIRNSWGNQAAPVSASDVGELRKKLGLQTLRLTDNSGDR
ncbi:MAG TPA: c-type cytochrome [Steroidobacteraceae bacterium]|jgi:mono/diheme cytochrome c family protein|nr:c-type cytochrome [Steroidobacteraceae bacterium]